jgi:hypothetical protein
MTSALAIMAAAVGRQGSTTAPAGPAGPVRVVVEDEAERIRDLPWADYDDAEVRAAAVAWATERWGRPGAKMVFRDIQALALLVAHLCDGAFLPIGTGWGKSLISLLAADALGAKRMLLLIPPAMRIPLDNARLRDYAPSFKIPPNLRVLAYSQLSQASSTDLLEKLAPDVIVADEAHNLRHADAARTKRLIRYLKAHPNTRVVLMSGTLTSKSVRDYAHLAEWALKKASPVPRPAASFPVLQAFCAILDAKPTKAGGADGGEGRHAAEAAPYDWSMFSPLFPDWRDYDVEERVPLARERYMNRLLGSPGVVGTDSLSVGASLMFIERRIETPPAVIEHLAGLEARWQRPDGEELVLALDKWRCGRQLSQGFYYRWKWPHVDNKPDQDDKDWLRTRAQWHREVREVCKRNLPHLDSPLLVTMAARKALGHPVRPFEVPHPLRENYTTDRNPDGTYDYRTDYEAQCAYATAYMDWKHAKEEHERRAAAPSPLAENQTLLHALEEWTPHAARRWRGKPTPPTETVWIDTFLLDDVMAWVAEHPTGLVWYSDHAIAEGLAERGMKVYGAGTNPEDLQGVTGAALSLHVHKDGKNLQKHSEALVISFDPSGTAMEQLVSREHRAGQEADEVNVFYYGHTEPTRNAIASARNDAAYIQATMNTPQRLCYGTWL